MTNPADRGTFTIYIVRHGATRLNNQASVSVDRERGWSDVPLTEEGRQEARKAGALLKGKHVNAIVSSDLNRAKETATIIGEVIGIKPEFSFKLRPWNLGNLTGKVMTEAGPQIAAYAQRPNEKVPGGESFNTFCDRAFDGLAEAAAKHREHTLVIVAHHRVERLVAGWEKAGQRPSYRIDIRTFLEKGDPPGGIITLRTTEAALRGQTQQKVSHAQAGYHEGHGPNDSHCSICEFFIVAAPPHCQRVIDPIRPNDGCKLFSPRKGRPKVERRMNAEKASVN